MSEFNPVKGKGFVAAAKNPVAPAVGAGDPQGNAKTSHAVAVPASCHPTETDVDVIEEVLIVNGFGHVGSGAHVILDTQPVAVVVELLLNTKVKHPSVLDDVNGPGKVVPLK